MSVAFVRIALAGFFAAASASAVFAADKPEAARPHRLPMWLIERLDMALPTPPDASANLWCYSADRDGKPAVNYCICYDADGCRALEDGGFCAGAVAQMPSGAGVCRQREDGVRPVI